MIIKRTTSFFLQKIYNGVNHNEAQIRFRVRWGDNLAQFNSGFTIDPKKWDKDLGKCKRNASNRKGYSSSDINKELAKLESYSGDVFKSFEVQEVEPTLQQFKDAFNDLNGKKRNIVPDEKPLMYYFLEFQREQGELNSWSESTYAKFNTVFKHLQKFDKSLGINDFTEVNLTKYVTYLRTVADLRNTSLVKSWKMVKWFLRWADSKNYLACKEYQSFSVKLKEAGKTIIFLTWDELMAVYRLEFPEDKRYLERARDLFCFQCFTSLRYSDLAALRRENIRDDKMYITIKKTGTSLSIDLNDYSRAILDKYKDDELPLPIITNQRLNEYIKDVCFLAEINKPITMSHYKGAERIDEVKPKYELISSHTGRKTFICNALSLGISPAVVMQWTGHSDFKAMKPYIGTLQDAKENAMKKFNKA